MNMPELALAFQLFQVFFLIGLLTIGGGYAMLPLIQNQVVAVHGWLSESAFTDIVAISQMTPGPIGINCATYVGYDVFQSIGASPLLCFAGSLTATFAVILPSFLIMLAIVRLYTRFRSSKVYLNVMEQVRPAVAGLIGAAAVLLMFSFNWSGLPLFSDLKVVLLKENFQDWTSWLLFACAAVASFRFKVGPIPLILCGGLLGLLLY